MTLSILIGISLSYAKQRKHSWLLFSFYALGIGLGLWEYFYAAANPKATNVAMIMLNRQIVVATFAVLALHFLLAVVLLVLRKRKSPLYFLQSVLIGLAGGLILLHVVPQMAKLSTTFVFYGESGFGTLALMRLIGYLLGIIACFVLGICAYKILQSYSERGKQVVMTSAAFLWFVHYFIKAIPALQRMKLVDTKTGFLGISVFDIMIFEDNHGLWLLYAEVLFLLLLAICAYVRNRKVAGKFSSPAAKRLVMADKRRVKRWAVATLLFCLYVPFTLSFLHFQNTKPPEEVALDSYEIQEGKIIISTESLADGKLHKYSYITPNNIDVKFLAVLKPTGTSYGLGLDACEICGTAGYYERGDEVICERCDVVMNKNTIGFHGGCNPIPMPYTIAEGNIYIELSDLQDLERKFR